MTPTNDYKDCADSVLDKEQRCESCQVQSLWRKEITLFLVRYRSVRPGKELPVLPLEHMLPCLHSGLLRLGKYLAFRRAREVICRAPEPHDITSRDRSVYIITASARSEKAEVARRVWVNMEGCCASCQPTLRTERERKKKHRVYSRYVLTEAGGETVQKPGGKKGGGIARRCTGCLWRRRSKIPKAAT